MNEKKIFDGDLIYTISVTIFAGLCAVGSMLIVATGKIF